MEKFLFFILIGCTALTTVQAEQSKVKTIIKGSKIAARILSQLNKELADMGINGMELIKYAKAHQQQLWQRVPEHKRRRMILFSPEHEKIFASRFYEELKKKNLIYHNSVHEARVRRVAEKITAVLPQKIPVKIILCKDDTINAACLADGTIIINRGVLTTFKKDPALVALLAHEYGHALARHCAEQLTKIFWNAAVGICTKELIKNTEKGKDIPESIIERAYNVCTYLGIILPYSRTMEYEADKIGMIYMAKAGYDPEGTIRFMKYIEHIAPDTKDAFEPYLSTHPLNKERIKKAQVVLVAINRAQGQK